ncbi:MAG: DNA primase, partial [Clostridiales bacterium]|nr:DNA primase [Clostridiales bacterium]
MSGGEFIYSREVIDYVREQNEIVSVISQYMPLKKKGGSHFGLCPFHHESTPSFAVNEGQQFFYCFGCGAAGNVISFVMKVENISFVEALKLLAERINYTLPEYNDANFAERKKLQDSLIKIHTAAAKFYYDTLLSVGKKANDYLDKRKISSGARKKFGLGFSPGGNALYKHLLSVGFYDEDISKSGLVIETRHGIADRFFGRLMFPIFNNTGKVVAFGGRILDENIKAAKYLNSPDTAIFDKSRNMYSLNYAKKEKTETVIICEGYMDVIAMYQAGVRNVAASLGTAFNSKHAAQIAGSFKTVILLFDADDAGEKATFRAIEALRHNRLEIKVLRLDGAKDPDEYIQKFGAENFRSVVNKAVPFAEFQLRHTSEKYDMSVADGKIKFAREAAVFLSRLEGAEREVYGREAAIIADIDESTIHSEIQKQEQKLELSQDALLLAEKRPDIGENKAVSDAQRGLLRLFAQNSLYDDIILKNISKEEFADDVYIKMFEIIIIEKSKGNASGETVNANVVLDSFADNISRQKAAQVFALPPFLEDEKKAVV